ncbi:MAG: HAMP domain-containing sensor histidine kinase [Candidatus Aminicenantes bacterium]|nr:HAMP domain-containing sensor histidine kinase [Candidatus Aminicenantes bacterium]
MLENLGIALRKQKKLILIFFLTIFLPALTLSVFGVRAIRNEKFRLAKQEENEGRRAARFIRAHVQSNIEAVASALEGMARDPAFIGKDHAAIHDLAEKRLAGDLLIGQAVLLYRNEEASFPLLLLPPERKPADSSKAEDAALAARIRRAEALEFVDKNFGAAAALYGQLATRATDRNRQAEMLTGQGRCLQKAADYDEAVRVYARIANGYSDSLTPSGLPLGILARLQAIECLERSGDPQGAAKCAFDAYRELLQKPSALSEDQFKTYISLVGESIDAVLAGEKGAQVSEEFRKEYADLKKLQSDRMKEWAAAGLLRKEIIPELARRLAQSEAYDPNPCRLSRNVEGRDLLLLAAWIPDKDGRGIAGAFGVQLNNDHLIGGILPEALGNAQLNDGMEVVLADLAGRPLSGKRNISTALPLVTEYFEDNFPPWKIELFPAPVKGLEILDLRRNFYFWTILTLVVVLAFGAFLIVRTIGHEMEILKIKSDFVSSVSHEFKTPLTSIKALMERLIDGKVRDPGKMDQYFSIIAQDADKLTRLVNNLLDFSKIEEGKKEYIFSDTDIVRIATEQVERFKKEQAPASPEMHLEITGEIPTLRADADALSRALANLLSNAVKFTPPGKAIRLRLSSDGKNIVLVVEDEGIGIHPDEVGKVFEKFFQGKNALDQTVKGTGLGLTLVKHIVEAHGGRIIVESRLGLGSKFSMVFPVKA